MKPNNRNLNKSKILVVEDDQALLDLYTELLTDEGYDVDQAQDGEIGLAKAKEGGYNLILLDIMLPKKDGLEILDELKTSGTKKKNGPIVILTNLNQEKILKQTISAGAACCLMKSMLTPKQVLHTVETFMDKKL